MRNFINYNNTDFENLTDGVITKELEEKFHFEIISMSHIDTGHVNKCVVVGTQENTFFCKISPLWYKKSLSREKWCLNKLLTRKVLVPKIVGLVEDNNENMPGHEILVLEYIPGKLISQLPNISDDILEKISKVYCCLHSFEVKKFGWLDPNFIGDKDGWLDFLLDIENLDLCRSISKELNKKINFLLNNLKIFDFKSLKNGCLLYGDFNLDNFILSLSGEIYALDFQNCFSGDPLYDYSIIIDKYPSFVKFLNSEQKMQKRLLKLYTLRYLLTRISYFIQKNDFELTNFYIKRFNSVYQKLNII
jgi:fructosamine-3-kinase